MLVQAILFVMGLLGLTYGAHRLVTGSAALALRLNVRPIVVGTTVVAIGTSLPEFLVSMLGQATGASGISLGNVVGSNIANIGLILGVASMIAPLSVKARAMKVEYVAMLVMSGLLYGLCADGTLSRLEGGVLCAAFLLMFVPYVRMEMKADPGGEKLLEEMDLPVRERVGPIVLSVVLGLGFLVGGAWLMVDSAEKIAVALHVPDHVIGLTIVAIGTSLPELATSVVAGMKGESDIAIGNILGSNVFNIGFVLGPAALLAPFTIQHAVLVFDLPVMLGFAVLLFPLLLGGRSLNRWKGALLLAAYLAFLGLQAIT